ncbi:MAG TPA: glycosyltransferase, partial [Verrucomicrobiae bacterium]|nr:glycosyltransferase [Verrucomicrobiae bacterium]
PRLVGWEHLLPAAVLEPDQNATAPLIRWLYRACDDLLLPSQQAKELFATQFAGKSAPNLHVVPPAIAAPQDSALTATEAASLARLKAPIIASVGQFDRTHDFKLVMRAFQYFSRTNEGTLLLIGEGAGRAALDSAATGFGLGNRMVVMEARDRAAALLSKADLYVSALQPSAFDHAMIHALRHGLPIVASDAPGGAPRAILADGRYGKLAPDGDARVLAQIIRDVIAAPKTTEFQQSQAATFSAAHAADAFLAAISGEPAREQAAA